MNGATAADYEMLGLKPGATEAEVKAAYRKLCTKVHPDAGGTDALFRQLTEAYNRILDGDAAEPIFPGPGAKETHEPWDPFAKVRETWDSSQRPPWETDGANERPRSERAERPEDTERPKRRPVSIWAAPFLGGRGPVTSFSAFVLFVAALFVSYLVATSTLVEPVRGLLAILPIVLAVGRIAATPTRLRR